MIPDHAYSDIPLKDMIASAQEGDCAVHNHLLKSYQPFVAKCTSEVCKRYIDPMRDDEFSIGLAAFNDAIMSYSSKKGSSFLSFAKLVIKRKVIDYIRYVQKIPNAASLDEAYEDEQMENLLEIAAIREIYQEKQKAWYIRDEMIDFKEQLQSYDLSLVQLAKASPKHKDARRTAITVAKILFREPVLKDYVERKKKLPIKDLTQKVHVSKKTLERNRKFILATFIILTGDFTYLKEYLKVPS